MYNDGSMGRYERPMPPNHHTLAGAQMAAKQCTKCGELKPHSSFNKSKGGLREMCKPCHSADSVRWQRENHAKYRARQNAWAKANKEKVRAYGRATYGRMSPEAKAKKAAYSRNRHLLRKYGLTASEWDALYEAQGSVCALCHIPGRLGRHGKLAVDHCHSTGRVRGLLCGPCNVALGILGDTPEAISRVAVYVGNGT